MTQEEELHHLREENAALRAENQELRQQVIDMETRLKQIEERLAKDSHNSHLPPSSDRFSRQKKTKSLRKKSDKKPGAQTGHEGTTLFQVSTPDQIIVHPVETCMQCQADLRAVAALQVESRQVLDLPPKRLLVIEHQTQQKVCPYCASVTKAPFPEGITAPIQYGPALGAVGVYLTQQQFLPYERACETIQDLLGPAMTVGTLKALIERCATHLQPIEEQIKEHLKQADVLHADESGMYVMGKRWWMHVAATPHLTHYGVHAKRGKEALDAIGILPAFDGVCLHDGWATYWKFSCAHALCNVHHLRELTFLHEQQQQAWAGAMKTLLSDMNTAVKEASQRGWKRLDPTEIADWKAQYHTLLQEGYQANPPPSTSDASPPKRRKQGAARNLLHRLSKHEEAVLAFMDDLSVPFTNNLAERDLRMIKVQQKISGTFRSEQGATAFCAIRSYLSTILAPCHAI
jgi:transposase